MATSSQIVKVTKGLTTAADHREDTKLLMQPHANWEEYLTPAPMSIAILAELIFISSNTDFSIRKGGPEGGFKYIKYPDSFRACLMQVCNSRWHAFNDAHKNMDQIRLYTNNVPNYIKLAVKILLQDDDNLVQTMLPDQLDNISNIADECVNLAQSTEKRFTDVIELIQELLETCTSAKQVYGNELEEVRRKISENERRKAAAEKATKRAQAYKNMNQQLKEGQESFESAMDSMPSGWDIIGIHFVEGLSGSVTTSVSGLTSMVTAPVRFDTNSKFETNTSAFHVKPPQITKTQEKSSGHRSAAQLAADNARLRIEQNGVQLEKARELYEKHYDNMEENKKKLTEILVTTRNCSVKKIDFNKTIQILAQGLQAMANVKEQWEKLVRFFQMVSNLMESCLTESLIDFSNPCETALKVRFTYTSRMFLKDTIYNKAFYASNIASLVNMIAGTYVEVSDKYLMDAVSKLSTLMTLDAKDIEPIRKRTAKSFKDAEEGIRKLIQENKENFERKTMQRLEKIESELKAVLPPESEEKTRERKEVVEKASKNDQDFNQYY